MLPLMSVTSGRLATVPCRPARGQRRRHHTVPLGRTPLEGRAPRGLLSYRRRGIAAKGIGREDAAGQEGEGEEASTSGGVNSILRRKQGEIQRALDELGERGLDELFSSAKAVEHGRSLYTMMEGCMAQGRAMVMVDVFPSSPATSAAEMGELAASYERWGADALTVWTDIEVSSHGMEDLQYVCSATRVPVIRKDWILHPIQIVETAAVGASGLTVINSIAGPKGMPMLFAVAAQLGLEVPIEVINITDVEAVEKFKIPVYGVNMTVGLNLALPGFRTSMLKSILGALPEGSKSVVGVGSLEEASLAMEAGASCLNLTYSALAAAEDKEALVRGVCRVARG